jgi:hypothetical protein
VVETGKRERGCRTDAQTVQQSRHRRHGYTREIDPAMLTITPTAGQSKV